MPVSKRDKKVSLTKTVKKGMPMKQQLVEKIRDRLNEYNSVYVFAVNNMRTVPLQEVRENWKDSRLFFAKKKVMAIALGRSQAEEMGKNLHKLTAHLQGQCGLLFTNKPKDYVVQWFHDYTKMDFARSGNIATETVTLPAGSLEEFTFSLEPRLRQLGMPTQLQKGKIYLREDFTVCIEGQKITPEQADILKLLGKPITEFKISLICKWSVDGTFEKFKVKKDQNSSLKIITKVKKTKDKINVKTINQLVPHTQDILQHGQTPKKQNTNLTKPCEPFEEEEKDDTEEEKEDIQNTNGETLKHYRIPKFTKPSKSIEEEEKDDIEEEKEDIEEEKEDIQNTNGETLKHDRIPKFTKPCKSFEEEEKDDIEEEKEDIENVEERHEEKSTKKPSTFEEQAKTPRKSSRIPKSTLEIPMDIENNEDLEAPIETVKSPVIGRGTPRRSMRTPKPIKRTPEQRKLSVKKLTDSARQKMTPKKTIGTPKQESSKKTTLRKRLQKELDVEMKE